MTSADYTGFFDQQSYQDFENQIYIGEVCHVFEHTINLVLKKQFPRLLTIGGMQVLGNPQSIAFANFQSIRPQLTVGQTVILHGTQQLQLPNLVCPLLPAKTATLEGSLYFPHSTENLKKVDDLKKRLIGQNTSQCHPAFAPFYDQLFREATLLSQALLEGNAATVDHHVQRMTGLGIGLTPSGDDLLTGMMSAIHHEKVSANLLTQSIFKALEGTNMISQHQLFFACQGRVKPSLLAVVQSILDDRVETTTFQRAITETLATGSTSGHDLLTGVLVGFEFLNRKGAYQYEISRKSNSESLH